MKQFRTDICAAMQHILRADWLYSSMVEAMMRKVNNSLATGDGKSIGNGKSARTER